MSEKRMLQKQHPLFMEYFPQENPLFNSHQQVHHIHLKGFKIPVLHTFFLERIVEPFHFFFQGLENFQAVFQMFIAVLVLFIC